MAFHPFCDMLKHRTERMNCYIRRFIRFVTCHAADEKVFSSGFFDIAS